MKNILNKVSMYSMSACMYVISYVIHVNYESIHTCTLCDSEGALVRSEFTVLMACGKKLCFSFSVLAA